MPKIIDFSAPEDEFESILDMEDEMEFQPAPELDMPFSKKLLDELNTVGFKVFVEYYKDFFTVPFFAETEYIAPVLLLDDRDRAFFVQWNKFIFNFKDIFNI